MPEQKYPGWMKWPLSAAGGVAGWLAVHPMDLLKVRMQLGGVSLGAAIANVRATKGWLGFYEGLSAGVARQLVYATARLGLYDVFRDRLAGDKAPSFGQRALAGLSSGAVASFISCPIEVCLVRMMADSRQPMELRRNYTSVFNALTRISKEEGVKTYWRGSTPTIVRAMMVGLTQVCFYDQVKAWLLQYKIVNDGLACHTTSSLITGLVYSAITMPIETCKTKMQDQRVEQGQTPKYKSLPGTLALIAKETGVKSLWNGYLPYYARCGGHTVGCFVILEQLKGVLNHIYA